MSLIRLGSGLKVSEVGSAAGRSHGCIMAERDDNGCQAGVTFFGFAQDRLCTQ
jgi:hypothetical protein